MQFQLKIQSLRPRDARDDDAVGAQLVAAVQRAMARGVPPSAAVSVRDERIDIFLGGDVKQAAVPLNLFLASLTRAEAPGGELHCVGLIGALTHRGSEVQQATVYLEWADCRWWLWRGLIGTDGKLRDGTESLLRAVDGDTKPMLIGGWWSLGRRSQLSARFDPHAPNRVH
ncbi:MAG: hypothetical protein EP330_11820 [Deltaproteobacteria bacterium]|nr:MAG: hypothetical protein EP330_11820 [Deltaproteobacteria bacterium]